MILLNNIKIEGNIFDKYHTKNKLYNYLMKNFISSFLTLAKSLKIESILEVGCGEGEMTKIISENVKGCRINASDISFNIVKKAKQQFPNYNFSIQSIYNLPYRDNEFDLIVACEVLEHLENPQKALMEINRVCKKYFIVSVPNEPIWRILNILRGKYIKSLGNTPSHIQHWSPNEFKKLVSNYFTIRKITLPFPWIMILCEKK
jgi:ubiquinone/menaquinone biosynthesis C-methylase UbiE